MRCASVCRWEQYGVIRFEMPYNIWCGGCGKHIRKGTRFNAKKKDAGKYFSTKIFAFHMKCACCPQQIGATRRLPRLSLSPPLSSRPGPLAVVSSRRISPPHTLERDAKILISRLVVSFFFSL